MPPAKAQNHANEADALIDGAVEVRAHLAELGLLAALPKTLVYAYAKPFDFPYPLAEVPTGMA